MRNWIRRALFVSVIYQLIRQKGAIQDRTFEIEFLDRGVGAFSFTFG